VSAAEKERAIEQRVEEEEPRDAPSHHAAEIVSAAALELRNSSPALLPVRAALTAARRSLVIVGMPLQVISLRLSPALRVTEIRARPFATDVSLHVLPQAIGGSVILPDRVFHLGAVSLDARGQIEVVRVTPNITQAPRVARRYAVTVDGIAISPAMRAEAIDLTPTAVAPMRFELLALFELTSVELSPHFDLEHLVLTAREEKMRATLWPEATHVGATFAATEVRRDAFSRVSEIALVAV
jgi:hypothetical protein